MSALPDLAACFEKDGFAVVEAWVSQAWCARLKDHITELVVGFDPATVQSVFTTHEQSRTTDRYFLESGDDVRFFLEEEAIDASGTVTVERARSVNKIGHGLHHRDPVFRRFGQEHDLVGIARSLGLERPHPLQSMAILKPPGIGGEVGWHQDATFLQTEPPSVVGLWFALDDATRDNGCLWAIPGGHRGPLRQRWDRHPDDRMEFVPLDDTPFATDDAIPLEVPAGTLVALHGLLPHRSDANRSEQWRHAYSLHLVDDTCSYADRNWLRRP